MGLPLHSHMIHHVWQNLVIIFWEKWACHRHAPTFTYHFEFPQVFKFYTGEYLFCHNNTLTNRLGPSCDTQKINPGRNLIAIFIQPIPAYGMCPGGLIIVQ